MKEKVKNIIDNFNPYHHNQACRGDQSEINTSTMASLAGKVAVVTGGTKGIGKAVAVALNRAGANVVVNYGRDASAADEVIKQLGADKTLAVQADAGNMDGIAKIVSATIEKWKKIDILIPNAGTMPMKTLEQTTENDFDRVYALNVKGPYFLAQVRLINFAQLSCAIILMNRAASGPSHAKWQSHNISVNYPLRCVDCDA
jgi:3-oxoacyl-[acyl-carrier protein] reductase